MRTAAAALVLLVAVFAGRPARATTAQDLFRQANQAYLAGRYQEAARLYEECLATFHVHNEHLFYNLGNSYFRLGRLGRAIYNYERALKLAPGLADARYNLETARRAAKAKGQEDVIVGAGKDPFWVRAVRAFRPGVLAALFLLAWYALLLGLGASYFLQKGVWRVVAGSASGLFLVATLVFGLLLLGRRTLDKTWVEGIVLEDVVRVYEGPRADASEAFRVHGGLRVRILDSDLEWYKIRLKNGLEGWVKRDQVGRL